MRLALRSWTRAATGFGVATFALMTTMQRWSFGMFVKSGTPSVPLHR